MTIDLESAPTKEELAEPSGSESDGIDLTSPPTRAELENYSPAEKAATFVGSALSNVSLGGSDVLGAALNARNEALSEILQAIRSGSLDPISAEKIINTFKQTRQETREAREALPGVNLAGQITGAIAPMGAAAALGKAGLKGAAMLASELDVGGQIAAKAAGLAGKLIPIAKNAEGVGAFGKAGVALAKTAKVGLEGAAGATATEATRRAIMEPTGFLEEGEAPSMASVAELGAAIPIGGKLVGGILKATKVMGAGAASLLMGGRIKPQAMEDFVNNFETIQNGKSVEEIKQAVLSNTRFIKENLEKSKVSLADDISNQLDALKKTIGSKSQEAFDILEASNKSFATQKLLDAASAEQNKLLIKGQLIGNESKAAYQYLDTLKGELASLGPEIAAPDVKRVIQRLDADYVPLAPGQFAESQSAKAISAVRRNVDQTIKGEIPEYAAKMKEVSELSDLHKRVYDVFGGKEGKTAGAVKAVIDQKNPLKGGLLEELNDQAPINLQAARDAKEAAESIRSLQDEATLGDRLMSFMDGARNPRLQRELETLGTLSREDFVKQIEAYRINKQFDRGITQGSRNVNLFSILLGLSPALLKLGTGHGIDPALAMFGAGTGAVMDVYGPTIVRQMLTAIAKIKGIPTIAKLQALSVPEDVKSLMIQDFTRAMKTGILQDNINVKEPFHVPEEAKAPLTQEILQAKHMTPEDKAVMIREMSEKGTVSELGKLVFSGAKKESKPKIVSQQMNKMPTPAEMADKYYQYRKKEQY